MIPVPKRNIDLDFDADVELMAEEQDNQVCIVGFTAGNQK